MSLKSWLASSFSFKSSRSPKQSPRRNRRPSLEVLEDRLTPDSGGAAGVLTSAGNLQFNPSNFNLVGFTPVIPNVHIQLIFVTDPNNGSPLTVPAATRTAITNFFAKITSDQYIPNLSGQYGGVLGLPAIGTGSVGVVDVSATANPDTTFSGHRAYTTGSLTSLILAEMAVNRTAPSDGLDNVYFVFTPPTDVVLKGNENSITDFMGMHSSFFDNGKRDYYSVIPDQSSVNLNMFGTGNTNALRGETMAASHEMSEAITDAVLDRGWINPTLQAGGENGDLAAEELYVHDGHEVQYEWSNAIVGAAHAPSSGPSDLFINQVTPPAVPISTSTIIPVATFTTANTALTAANFSASVYSSDSTGHGKVNWTVTAIIGSVGHFIVYAKPSVAVMPGTYGLTFAGHEGLFIQVTDNSAADAGKIDGGNPVSIKYAPYVVAATSPLTYITDAGTHNLVVKQNGPNIEVRDGGSLVFTQPFALTTSIAISGNGDPAGVDNSLTVDFSGGVFSLPVTFDGGNGSGVHKLTLTGASLSSLVYDATGAHAGDFVVNGNAAGKISFAHAQSTVDSAAAGIVNINVDPQNSIAGLVSSTLAAGGASSVATFDNGLTSFTFGNPTATLAVTGHSADDHIDIASLGSGFSAALTVTGNGGADTADLDTTLNLGAGNVSIAATVINLNAPVFAVGFGGPTAGLNNNHYGQLHVAGSVTINSNAMLNLSSLGGFAPAPGESFTLIDNTAAASMNGAFANLPEGAVIDHFLGSGLNAVVTYSGGPNHNDMILSVPSSTQTTLASSANPSTFGKSVTFTATVSAAGGTPSGTVSFMDGATTLGTGTLDGNGVATFSTSNLSAGTHSITATYVGNGGLLGSDSSAVSQVVAKANSATKLTPTSTSWAFGQPMTFAVNVTFADTTITSSATPMGTVLLLDGTKVIGTATVVDGKATFLISDLAKGTHSIRALYEGDADFLSSLSSPLAITIR